MDDALAERARMFCGFWFLKKISSLFFNINKHTCAPAARVLGRWIGRWS